MSKESTKKPLHQPIPELVKALAMPEEKRRKARNKISPSGTYHCQGGTDFRR